MLKHTLILPDKASDGRLAVKLLQDAIGSLDVVLMLVLGRDQPVVEIVHWADQLCAKTQITSTMNLRRVVWIREPEVNAVDEVLTNLLGTERPLVVVLNFHDEVKVTLKVGDTIDPLALEKAFLEGQSV